MKLKIKKSMSVSDYATAMPHLALIPSDISSECLYEIVDDLLEHDLLGLLLSTTHLQIYCKWIAHTAKPAASKMINAMAVSYEAAESFQFQALQKFSGIHIEECMFKNKGELSRHLNERLNKFINGSTTLELEVKMSKDIENAWKYRLATQGIRF